MVGAKRSKLNLSDSELRKKVERLRVFAKVNGCDDQTSDDFSQNCAELWLSGKRDLKTNFSWLLTDYLRLNGRKTRKGKLQTDALLGAAHFESESELQNVVLKYIKGHSEPTRGLQLLPEKFLSSLNTIERLTIILRFVWEFKNVQIAYCLGVTDSRVAQIVGEALTTLRKKRHVRE
jgi:hypothetical protein